MTTLVDQVRKNSPDTVALTLSDADPEIFSSLGHNTNIYFLGFYNTELSKEDLTIIVNGLQDNTSVEILKFVNTLVDPDGLDILFDFLRENQIIEELDISDIILTSQNVQNLADLLAETETLKRIGIGHLTNSDLEILARSLYKGHLETLDIIDNSYTSSDQSEDEDFDEKVGHITEFSLNSDSAAILGQLLLNNNTLKTLTVSYNNIGSKGAQFLAKALLKNTGLESLDISYNDIGPGGAISLARALLVNTSLKTLDLSNNRIGDPGAVALARVITKGNLKHLRLSFNSITKLGYRELRHASATNHNLELYPATIRRSTERLRKRYQDAAQVLLNIYAIPSPEAMKNLFSDFLYRMRLTTVFSLETFFQENPEYIDVWNRYLDSHLEVPSELSLSLPLDVNIRIAANHKEGEPLDVDKFNRYLQRQGILDRIDYFLSR